MILRILFNRTAELYLKINKYIQSKNKRPLLAYILSEIIYGINLLIGRKLINQEFNKLDFKKIRNYYELYGEDATLKNFKLSKQVLDKILYWFRFHF